MNKILSMAVLAAAFSSAAQGVEFSSIRETMVDSALVQSDTSSPVTVCRVPLNKIKAKESIVLDGFVVVTNDNEGIVGFTAEMYICDPTCRNMRNLPNWANFGGGNVSRIDHHGIFRPAAKYYAMKEVPKAWGILTLRSYSTSEVGKRISVDHCGILASRYPRAR